MTIDTVLPAIVSATLGGTIAGMGSYVAVRVSLAEMRRDHIALAREVAEIKRQVGLDGSGRAAFVARGECPLLEAGFRPELTELRAAVGKMSERVSEVAAEVHVLTKDHENIKARLG